MAATKGGVEVLRPDQTCSSRRYLTVPVHGQEPENPENELNFLFHTYLPTHAGYALLNRLSSDTHLRLHFFVRFAENGQKQDLAIGFVPMSHHIRLPILSSNLGSRIDDIGRPPLIWMSVTPVLLYLFVAQNQHRFFQSGLGIGNFWRPSRSLLGRWIPCWILAGTHNRRVNTAKFQLQRFQQSRSLWIN